MISFGLLGLVGLLTTGQQDSMEVALREEGLVGAVWATVADGVVTTGAAGSSDARAGTPIRPDARVHIGSVVKTLISVGVLSLATEGRLGLDAQVADLVPGLVFTNPWAATHPLRVRHLLDHTSGLDDARFWQVFSLEAEPDTPLSATVNRHRALLELRSRPGSRMSYSNMGYVVAAMVIEAVTGERYETYLDANLLGPLGMTSSTFGFVSQVGERADARLAMGHFEKGVTEAAVPSWLRPAGQFTTTAGDMATFAAFLMGDGTVAGRIFVDPALLAGMGTPVGTEAADVGLTIGYGLGLARRDRHGVVGKCHGGNTVGYRAMLCIFPDDHKAFFVAMNADSEVADYGRFDGLLVRHLGVVPSSAVEGGGPADLAEWNGIYVPSPNRFAMFSYLDLVTNFATARWDGSRLAFKPFQSTRRELTPVAERLLRAEDRTVASHALVTDDAKPAAITDGLQTYQRASPWRMGALWLSLLAGLAGLIYVVAFGVADVVRRRRRESALIPPLFGVLALLVPIPLFLSQSFLRLGDPTLAGGVLAVATGIFPLVLGWSLWRARTRSVSGIRRLTDRAAMIAVLQWTMVLAFWGLIPLRLWA